MSKEKMKLQPVGIWLKEGCKYVFSNWQMLLKVYLFSVLMYLGSFVLFGIVVGGGIGLLGLLPTLIHKIMAGIVVFVLGIGGFLFILAQAGKMIYIQILASKEPIAKIRETWRKIGWKEGLGMYWLMILAMFAGYGGMILLIIPGIVILTWVSLSWYVRVEQGVGGVKALMLSRDYIRGYGWQVFWRWILSGFLTMLFVAVFAFGYMSLIEMGSWFSVIGYILYMLGVGVMMWVMYRLGYTMYLDLMRIKGRLALVTTSGRTFRWNLLVCSPLVLMVLAVIFGIVVGLVNPARQIERARDSAVEQNSGVGDKYF